MPEAARPEQAREAANPARSRHLAEWGLLFLAVSMLTSWWTVEHGAVEMQDIHTHHTVRPFSVASPLSNDWATLVAGILVVGAGLLVLVRLAAHSWSYEPRSWRRDLWIACLLTVAAVVSLFWWPGPWVGLWSHRTFTLQEGGGPVNFESAHPGIGVVFALMAVLFFLGAAVAARPARNGSS